MESQMTITIHIRSFDPDEHFGGAEFAPMLKLSLDQDGSAEIGPRDLHSSDRNSWTFDEHHRRTLSWTNSLSQGVLVLPDYDKIAAIAAQAEPLLARVAAAHSVEWDGSNMVGRTTADAEDAIEALERLFYEADWTRDDLTVQDAEEWLLSGGYNADEEALSALDLPLRDAVLGLRHAPGYSTTLSDAAEEATRRAREDDVILLDAEGALRRIVERLRDAAWWDIDPAAPKWVVIPEPGMVANANGWLRADWAQASSPIQALYGDESDAEWVHTGKQVADYGHDSDAALADLMGEEAQG
jgi:hypothetical protein